MPVEPVNINSIREEEFTVYEAVLIMAKRARQIHDRDMKKFKDQVGEMEDERDLNDVNVDREKLAITFDKQPKPTKLALQELRENKIQYKFSEETEEE